MTISTDGTCWYPDGETIPDDVPCNTTAGENGDATACCGKDALCMANGLCLNWGILSRGSCTDNSWGKGCPQVCKDTKQSTGVRLLSCSVNSNDITRDTWACDGNGGCDDPGAATTTLTSNVLVLARPTQLASLAADVGAEVVTTRGAGASGTATAAATATGASCSADDGGGTYSSGDMAGVGLGVGVPLLLALLAAIWLWRREARSARKGMRMDGVQWGGGGGGSGGGNIQLMDQPQPMYAQQKVFHHDLHQQSPQQVYQEIGTDGERAELPPK
ncbi:hypothetical protein HDK90DRAFT_62309 [Phyllosticta capitalensis]|uniref:Uncharacterized protein n=1 Tax=Phyllosticta capitalensis TaxID=121624 RepID=A0ABR1YF05_9PEZI